MGTRSMLRNVVATGVALTTATALAACGGESRGSEPGADDPYRVYVSIDLSGPTKSYSLPIVAGLKLAADRVNEQGGVEGREIEVEAVDDQSNPTKAISLLQKRLSEGDKPDLVYAGGSSAVSLSLLPILTRNKIVSLSGTVSSVLNDPAKFPYHFSVSPPSTAYGPGQAAELEAEGFEKVAMLHSKDATGQSSMEDYKAAAEEAGIEFVASGYEASALDMTPQLQQLRDEDPDALIINGYGTAALYAFRGRAQLGWDIPTYGDQLSSSYPLVDQLGGEKLENVKVVTSSASLEDAEHHSGLAQLIEEIKSSPEADLLPVTGFSLFLTGYDFVQLAAYASEQAGATDAESVAGALEDLEAPEGEAPWMQANGESMKYAYSAENHFPTAEPSYLTYVAPGKYNENGYYVPGGN